ncbi:MAG: Spy/CpxP family protein refolding chaperone [Pseudolabrys sp.]|nr:Spy/CpxP family protein refolding chaperone [Pseudolabrys sp.]
MLKSVLATATALAIAGGTLAYAQQGPGKDRADGAQRWRPSAEDVTAFGDARIAALKAGLKLTADQEKLWPPLEKALRDRAKVTADRFAARASADRPTDPIERMQLRAQRMTEMGASLKTVADAAAPLYKSLDDGQKHRFVALAKLEGNRFRDHFRGHHWRRGGEGGRDNRDGGPRPQ